MTGQELWVEVMEFVTIAEVIEAAKETGRSVQDLIHEAVTEWSQVMVVPEGYTVESITAALVQVVEQMAEPSN